ncbi:uncharacterized protein G2W53_039501 [Senna tora]|uniref:Uncharacterized protein n=1 Tax=Senna tora TaxID=362788 RepID=A0A834SMM4_9FABA|nr:uncharacterized protein G2W53_039501 [Senna tora]
MAQARDSISEESLSFSSTIVPSLISRKLLMDPLFIILRRKIFLPHQVVRTNCFLNWGEGIVYNDLPERVRAVSCTISTTSAMATIFHLFLENAFIFSYFVAGHPFQMSLLSFNGIGFLFFTYVARVMGVVPPFSAFTMSFLNCVNVCPVQLVPNVWASGFIFVRQATLAPLLLTGFSRNIRNWDNEFVRIIMLSDLSDSDQDVVAHLTRCSRDMRNLDAAQTYVQYVALAHIALVVSVDLASSNEPLRVPAGGSRGSPPLGSPVGEMRASESPPSREGQAPSGATTTRNVGDLAEDALPSHRPRKEPTEDEDRVREATLHDGLPLAVKLAVKLLFEALLGLHGVAATAHSELALLRIELTVASQTIEELRDALSVKDSIISSSLRTGFGHIDLARPNGVKEESVSPKGPPPGFDFPIDKNRDNGNDSRDGIIPLSCKCFVKGYILASMA